MANQTSNFDIQTLANLVNQVNQLQSAANRANKSPIMDPMSPYFLHPGESPGTPLISVILGPSNYHAWERAMCRALRSKNKLKFVDGTLVKPSEDDSLFDAWDRCNTYVVSWLNLSLSPEIAHSVVWMDVAADIWRSLRHRYYQGDSFRMAELQEELFSIRQGDLNITAYFTKLKGIWKELDNFRPIPACKYCTGTCDCGLDVMRNYQEDTNVVRLLRGLNDQFAVVRSQIMLMKPLPTVDATFSLLLQQERQNADIIEGKALITMGDTRANQGFNPQINMATRGGRSLRARGGRLNGRGGRGQTYKQCVFCGKSGHTEDVYYKKHGYPPHMRSGSGSGIINMVTDLNGDNISNNTQEAISKLEAQFSADQRAALLALLERENNQQQSHNTGSNHTISLPSNQGIAFIMSLATFSPNSWVIDSGASEHVSFSLKSFKNLYHIKPIRINLPDGTQTVTDVAGTIEFSNTFHLVHALYIPNFKFNLISVSKLTTDLKCEFVFNDSTCEI
ncbi:uncharacterized protein [Arachis hypogaea]|uniref:uncharacterized protein n=1 Tax=Arachis hypogaea TaxID=3818 RepID=UPI000DEDFCB4|nr:uncharacterized protein LOC112786225 [Arachis hypogaea]